MKKLTLPVSAQKVINSYLNITCKNLTTPCPYRINHGVLSRRLSLLGKGSPRQIEDEVKTAFSDLGFNPKTSEELRSFMRACGLGIDCSGLASHILDQVSLEFTKKPLKKQFKAKGAKSKLATYLRKNGAFSASTLTSPKNCTPVEDLAKARPGDLIRLPGGRHVILVYEVSLDSNKQATEFKYVQSSCNFLEESGVVTGRVKVKVNKSLQEQKWEDDTELKGVTQAIIEKNKDSHLVRPKFLASK